MSASPSCHTQHTTHKAFTADLAAVRASPFDVPPAERSAYSSFHMLLYSRRYTVDHLPVDLFIDLLEKHYIVSVSSTVFQHRLLMRLYMLMSPRSTTFVAISTGSDQEASHHGKDV